MPAKERREKLIALARSWQGPQGCADKPAAKRKIDIEALLRWAYREELPKIARQAEGPQGYARAWDAVDRWAEELSLKLDDNRFGVVPDFSAALPPHEDALAVHAAMIRLDQLELSIPDGWNPLSDIALGDHEAPAIAAALEDLTSIDKDGVNRLKVTPRRLVFKHAILGGCPVTEIDVPETRFVCVGGEPKWFRRELRAVETCDGGSRMEEIEVDGFDHKWRMPKPDAYRKTYLDPDPQGGIVGRAEYELWHAALGVLYEDLLGMLQAHEVTACERPMRPWEEEAKHFGKIILPDLAALRVPYVPKKARRVHHAKCFPQA